MCRSTILHFKTSTLLPYIWLIKLPWQSYIGLILWEKLRKMYLPLPFLQYWSHLVCMCRSISLFFKNDIIPNIQLIWLEYFLCEKNPKYYYRVNWIRQFLFNNSVFYESWAVRLTVWFHQKQLFEGRNSVREAWLAVYSFVDNTETRM